MTSSNQVHALHAAAVARGLASYVDPSTGYRVFTEVGLRARGACCGCGCRHCPFGHEEVPNTSRIARAQVPTLIDAERLTGARCDVLFWSGGKDSYLAYLQCCREAESRDVVLLTTFDAATRVVAHQDVSFPQIAAQSRQLGVALLGIPMVPGVDYLERIVAGLTLLSKRCSIDRLVFGDLHLQHIRDWRESNFGPLAERLNCILHFPLWQRSYADLLAEFEASGARAEVTAAPFGDFDGTVHVGDRFDRDFVDRLPEEVDPFGENGEFHTLVSWPAP